MEFVDKLKDYKFQREQIIQSKKNLLKQLKTDYQDKLGKIKECETKYQLNFDDKEFDKLTVLKGELENIEINLDKVQSQLNLMDVGQLKLNNDDIKNQINDYVDSFNLEELRKNVLKAKQDYLDSINQFSEATRKIEIARGEIDSLVNVMDQENKKTIVTAFYHYLGGYYLSDNYFAKEIDFAHLKSEISRQGTNITEAFQGTNGYGL